VFHFVTGHFDAVLINAWHVVRQSVITDGVADSRLLLFRITVHNAQLQHTNQTNAQCIRLKITNVSMPQGWQLRVNACSVTTQ